MPLPSSPVKTRKNKNSLRYIGFQNEQDVRCMYGSTFNFTEYFISVLNMLAQLLMLALPEISNLPKSGTKKLKLENKN